MISYVGTYIDDVKKKFITGNTTEHSFRPDLQKLIEETSDQIQVINEPRRSACGAPDYVIQKNSIPLGYVEAKDIDKNLDRLSNSDIEQQQRYLKSLSNLIYTNYLDFIFFREGKEINRIKIGEISHGKIYACTSEFKNFENYIHDFCSPKSITISNPSQLAEIMAQKAVLMREILEKALAEQSQNNTLSEQMKIFKGFLLKDLTEKSFADVYAQTITYGLFVARLNDPTLDDFSLQEARDLVSRTNPFLRSLFDSLAGADRDPRIDWLFDDLVDIFRHVNFSELLQKDTNLRTDPFLYFYEHFLEKYDKETKVKRGVYYTPQPIVKFIVNAVDKILKTDFQLSSGLADTTRISTTSEPNFKVQILDPAIGTGTFLAEVIRKIYEKFSNQKGAWNDYVEHSLIPRLHGFEIMMTPYVICHIKLEKLLAETGYKKSSRMQVYLTNSLESGTQNNHSLFSNWIIREAQQANYVKENAALMVIIGNPPYSVSSCNKNEYIDGLTKIYKEGLNEKNIQPLSDDYIKFIRLGENFIEKNQEGILAYISNNTFLDARIHRKMREHLLKTFDKIFVINLHGNARKKEKSPDGSKDENVFDIMTGVCVTIFVKIKDCSNEFAKVYYMDLFGTRDRKFDYLKSHLMRDDDFIEVKPKAPQYFFVPKDFSLQEEYDRGFRIDEMFEENNCGIVSGNDNVSIRYSLQQLNDVINNIIKLSEIEFLHKYQIKIQKEWNIYNIRNEFLNCKITNFINKILYRPFDERFTIYSKQKNFLIRPRYEIMKHLLRENVGLCISRNSNKKQYDTCFVINLITDYHIIGDSCRIFPLYLYDDFDMYEQKSRRPNLNADAVQKFAKKINLEFTSEKSEKENTFAPLDILDYVYGILCSNKYREKYAEFLRIVFPKIPYPKNREYFSAIAALGKFLRELHLMNSSDLNKFITSYPIEGDNVVSKIKYEGEKVFINKTQFFEGISEAVWNFSIGSYQPAQKWLKDRRQRTLTADDIFHYQKIIVALKRTIEIMQKIDEIIY